MPQTQGNAPRTFLAIGPSPFGKGAPPAASRPAEPPEKTAAIQDVEKAIGLTPLMRGVDEADVVLLARIRSRSRDEKKNKYEMLLKTEEAVKGEDAPRPGDEILLGGTARHDPPPQWDGKPDELNLNLDLFPTDKNVLLLLNIAEDWPDEERAPAERPRYRLNSFTSILEEGRFPDVRKIQETRKERVEKLRLIVKENAAVLLKEQDREKECHLCLAAARYLRDMKADDLDDAADALARLLRRKPRSLDANALVETLSGMRSEQACRALLDLMDSETEKDETRRLAAHSFSAFPTKALEKHLNEVMTFAGGGFLEDGADWTIKVACWRMEAASRAKFGKAWLESLKDDQQHLKTWTEIAPIARQTPKDAADGRLYRTAMQKRMTANAYALGCLRYTEALDALIEALALTVTQTNILDNPAGFGGHFAQALAAMGDAKAVPAILKAMEAPTSEMDALRGMEALGKLGDERAIPLLEKLEQKAFCADGAREALRKIRGKSPSR